MQHLLQSSRKSSQQDADMYTVAEQVQLLAEEHSIALKDDHASRLANAINRLEGIEPDATLELIAALINADVITKNDGIELAMQHHDEKSDSASTLNSLR
jgi:hypothetical protein